MFAQMKEKAETLTAEETERLETIRNSEKSFDPSSH